MPALTVHNAEITAAAVRGSTSGCWAAGVTTPTAVTAIETTYRGYRFRSRLEARWAVFFDHLGLTWRYEPQGYCVGDGGLTYLPDFYVDELKNWGGGWVEVKGSMTDMAARKLFAAASLNGLPVGLDDPPMPAGALCTQGFDFHPWPRMLVLGDVPEPGEQWAHIQVGVTPSGEVVWRTAYFWKLASGDYETIPVDDWMPAASGSGDPTPAFMQVAPHGHAFIPAKLFHPTQAAYKAARSARFEHGESGAAWGSR